VVAASSGDHTITRLQDVSTDIGGGGLGLSSNHLQGVENQVQPYKLSRRRNNTANIS
jgi:hypothetical protein